MKEATVVLLRRGTKVLLPKIKRGFCANSRAGVGGKVEKNELVKACAVRELNEELRIKAHLDDLIKIAELDDVYYDWVAGRMTHRWRVYFFFLDVWEGEPQETNEADPTDAWFDFSSLPWDDMFVTYALWFPIIIRDDVVRDFIKLSCEYDQDNQPIDVRFTQHTLLRIP